MWKVHTCNLPSRNLPNISCLPKLSPSTRWFRRWFRFVREQFLMNHKHFRCKKLFRSIPSILAEKRRHARGPHFFVIHPLSSFNLFLEFWFLVLWSYGLIVEPLMIFMNDILAIWWLCDLIVSTCRIVIIALFFNLGYVDHNTKDIVLDPKKIIPRYLKTYFIFDFLTTNYSLEYAVHFAVKDMMLRVKLKLTAYIIRTLAGCVRLKTLLGILKELLSHVECHRVVKYLLIYSLRTYIYLHLSTFLIYLVPRITYEEGYTPMGSWITQANVEAGSKSITPTRKYLECLLMASSYFFGLHHKYHLDVLNEQICFTVITLFGRLYTLFLLADVLSLLGLTRLSESKYDSEMSMLRHYMSKNCLSTIMRHRMLKYCQFKFQGRYFHEQDILDTLSEGLRAEILLFSAKCMIGKVSLLRKVSSYTLTGILAAMTARYYSPRDAIIKIGSMSDEIYFISSGTVAMINVRGLELCHLEDGEMFGVTCLVLRKQIYGVVAVEATQLYVIDKHRLVKFLDKDLIKHLYILAMQRLDFLKALSLFPNVSGKTDVLSQLKRGNILEKLTKKVVAQ